jgi:predicted membrane protein
MHPGAPSHSRWGKIVAGVIFLAAGIVLLLRQLGYFFPDWLISWPMLLIALGAVIGAKHQFKHPAWLVPVGAGALFLLDQLHPGLGVLRFVAPVLVIGLGLVLIFAKQRHFRLHRRETPRPDWHPGPEWEPLPVSPGRQATGSEFVEAVSVFGGVKKSVLSKHFAGGEIVAFMGGIELNLSQADIQGRVKLEVTQVLGGTRLIVPPHWDVVSEMTAVLGGIEDKRVLQPGLLSPDKVLFIEGTSVLGGIEIHSYA